ncbi:uncharacterized protein UBRO_03249 [Ustilago bromivora]|uniref:Uncharacterized protein n=1 Tax=Ustilago bromivora TaxID=307758 RepID=A0A1K0HBN3_9BASI|nr:uncharacterized protein UBRO_03249 [Ustilago bromivora]SYW83213.1 uncharacterized protein UBRO2_05104 [Ustilago bromivora]
MVLHGHQELWIASPDVERYEERTISNIENDEVPVLTVGIGGLVGAPFFLRAGKQGFPDGVTVVTQSEKGRETESRYDAEPDLVYKHRDLYDNIRCRNHFWTFEREDWIFGSVKVLVVQVLPRTIDKGFDGKGFIFVIRLACIEPAMMQALCADERLLQRLNNLSLTSPRRDTHIPTSWSTRLDASRSSSTAPALTDFYFDPLEAARRAREFRRGEAQPRASPFTSATQPPNRGTRRGVLADVLEDEFMPPINDETAQKAESPEAIQITNSEEEDEQIRQPRYVQQPLQIQQPRHTVDLFEDSSDDDKTDDESLAAGVRNKDDEGDDDDDDDDAPLTNLIKRSTSADDKDGERPSTLRRRASEGQTRDRTRVAADRRSLENDDELFDDANFNADVTGFEEPRRRSSRLLAKQKIVLVKPTFNEKMLELVRLHWRRPTGELLAENEAAEIVVADNPRELARIAAENEEMLQKAQQEREKDKKHRDEHESNPEEYIPVNQIPVYIKLIAGGDAKEPIRRSGLEEHHAVGDEEIDVAEPQSTRKRVKDGNFFSITFIDQELQRRWLNMVNFKLAKTAWFQKVQHEAAVRSRQHAKQALKITRKLCDRT